MKVIVTENKGLKATLSVLIKKNEIEKKIQDKAAEIQGSVNLKGFRPGKVPVNLLKKQFGNALYNEVLEKTLQESTFQALNENKIKTVGQPKIEIKSSGEDKDLEYLIFVEKAPDIKKIDLEKISLTNYKPKIEVKEVEERIRQLAEGQKKYINKKDNSVAEKNDLVVFNFEALVDGKPFEGNKGEKVSIILGKNLFIKGFDEKLIGVKSGQDCNVEVKLPENYPNKEIANKLTKFKCKILEVKIAEEVKVDDQFAKNLGAKDLKDLKDLIEKQISREYSSVSETILRKQILDYLDNQIKIDLPSDLLINEKNIVRENFLHEKAHKDEPHDHTKHGHDHSNIKLTKEEEDDIEDIASRRVKLALVLNQIGDDNKIEVTPQELQNELQKQLAMYPGQEKKIKDYYQKNPSELIRLRGPIYEDKIVELIKSKSKVKESLVSKKEFEDLVNRLSENLKSKLSSKDKQLSSKPSDTKSVKTVKKSISAKKVSKK